MLPSASDDAASRVLPLSGDAPLRLPADRVIRSVVRVSSPTARNTVQDTLAQETPIALSFNGISHATMLATPTALEDFAVGFSLTEGIVARIEDIRDITLDVQKAGVVIEVEIAPSAMNQLKSRKRAMAGRTGCGLCGVETLSEVARHIDPVGAGNGWHVSVLSAGMSAMRAQQALHDATGATHAAAWMTPDGALQVVREDVGRHNALDKLLGALARQQRDIAQGAVLVSSRASFEMVQKTASQGGTVLVAASAPTDMAWQIAEQSHLTLIGFMRGAACSIYTGQHRITA